MAKEIKLPRLGETMEEGIIVNCLVEVGRHIKKGDYLFEIETDKATFQMESPEEGFVKAILAQPGQTLPVGQVLLILDSTELAEVGQENEKINMGKTANKKTPAGIPAEKLPMQKITQADLTAAAQDPTAYKLGQKIPLSRLAKKQAEKMLQSKRQIPCFYLNITVDATELVSFRQKLNESADVKISFNDFLMRALALGMAQWPIMTGRLEGDNIQLADSIGIGLAIAADKGLVAPIVKDVDKKNLTQIAQYRTALVERTRAGKLTPDDLEGGCITISNLGAIGIDSFIPIVVPDQCSILGVGKITDTCVSQDDKTAVRKFMKMTLAVDHRVANGAEAAQFLSYVGKLLEDPQKLV
jgi:pyruvate dehydrogenase E2 component (dihydrolipoamide acetyltransferase)